MGKVSSICSVQVGNPEKIIATVPVLLLVPGIVVLRVTVSGSRFLCLHASEINGASPAKCQA